LRAANPGTNGFNSFNWLVGSVFPQTVYFAGVGMTESVTEALIFDGSGLT
jgi:hypothetical protein